MEPTEDQHWQEEVQLEINIKLFKVKIMALMFHNHIMSSGRVHECKQNQNISELQIWASNKSIIQNKWAVIQ